jgi:hypothetical protein
MKIGSDSEYGHISTSLTEPPAQIPWLLLLQYMRVFADGFSHTIVKERQSETVYPCTGQFNVMQ